jgi:hypothetical protein
MAEQDLIRLACENVEAYNVGNWQRLKAVLAPDVVYHEVGSQRRLQGADQLIEAYQHESLDQRQLGGTGGYLDGNAYRPPRGDRRHHTSLWQVVVTAGRSADNFPGR